MCLGSWMEVRSGLGTSRISTGLGSFTTHKNTPLFFKFRRRAISTMPTYKMMPTNVIHMKVLSHSFVSESGSNFAAPALQTCQVPSAWASLASTKMATFAGPGLLSIDKLGAPPRAGTDSTAVRSGFNKSTQLVDDDTCLSNGAGGKLKDHLSVVGSADMSKTTSTGDPTVVAESLRNFQYAMWLGFVLPACIGIKPESVGQDLRILANALLSWYTSLLRSMTDSSHQCGGDAEGIRPSIIAVFWTDGTAEPNIHGPFVNMS
mmetsp:Transcript_103399/g.299073  ORF Transcript_103399/g.299073 Transcript_103399/m.299073 type:complete len:262 (+) Transcript_103399:3489-4274(+)